MKNKGYTKFSIHYNTVLWQNNDGQNPAKNFGTLVEGKWYWYESWLKFVEEHCKNNKEFYK